MLNFAISRGDLARVRYLVNDDKSHLNSECCSIATRNGQVDTLHLLRQLGCPWDRWTALEAAKAGNLQCLEYAYANGVLCDDVTCVFASRAGHVDCLRFLFNIGCNFSSNVCYAACLYDRLECLIFACEEAATPCNSETCVAAVRGKL